MPIGPTSSAKTRNRQDRLRANHGSAEPGREGERYDSLLVPPEWALNLRNLINQRASMSGEVQYGALENAKSW